MTLSFRPSLIYLDESTELDFEDVVLAGFRQTARIRQRYLTSALQQEISFFDTHATTGDLLQGLNELSNIVQSGIGDKAGNTLHHLGTFVAGFAIGMNLLPYSSSSGPRQPERSHKSLGCNFVFKTHCA